METSLQQTKLHSQDYFNEQRDFWWNLDFLELMAKRWQFQEIHSVLDVGCGVGHWGQLLASILPSDCKFTGVDQELEWTVKAQDRAKSRGLGERFRYQQGQAEALPFADNSFDLVTCQTVLMHLKDPKIALREFLRVLKPGGLILAAEPNNMAGHLLFDSLSEQASIEDILQRIRFHLTCERGKKALGEGHSSIGCLIPGMFAELGLQSIAVDQSDKASALYPPYENDEQKVNTSQMLQYFEKELAPWGFDDARRYYLAGGGSQESFEQLWQSQLARNQTMTLAIKDKLFHTAGGGVFYLVSGRKG